MPFNCSLDIFLYFHYFSFFLIEARNNAVSWINLYNIASNIDHTVFSQTISNIDNANIQHLFDFQSYGQQPKIFNNLKLNSIANEVRYLHTLRLNQDSHSILFHRSSEGNSGKIIKLRLLFIACQKLEEQLKSRCNLKFLIFFYFSIFV